MKPLAKLNAALAVRHAAAMAGAPGAAVAMKAAHCSHIGVASSPAVDEVFRPGRIFGSGLDMRPASFMNATMEPVKVMPPMRTPR